MVKVKGDNEEHNAYLYLKEGEEDIVYIRAVDERGGDWNLLEISSEGIRLAGDVPEELGITLGQNGVVCVRKEII